MIAPSMSDDPDKQRGKLYWLGAVIAVFTILIAVGLLFAEVPIFGLAVILSDVEALFQVLLFIAMPALAVLCLVMIVGSVFLLIGGARGRKVGYVTAAWMIGHNLLQAMAAAVVALIESNSTYMATILLGLCVVGMVHGAFVGLAAKLVGPPKTADA